MIEISGAYDGAAPQKSCSSEKLFLASYFAGDYFLMLAGRAKTGWHSNTVICCYRNLLSISYVIDICNFVRLESGVLVIFEYFWGLWNWRFFESYFRII